jgi:hypothetical protein
LLSGARGNLGRLPRVILVVIEMVEAVIAETGVERDDDSWRGRSDQ